MSVGKFHCLIVSPAGALYSVGRNNMGQLGNPSLGDVSPSPVRVLHIGRVMQTAVGLAHSIVLTADGEVYAFGDNLHGQLGQPGLRYADQPIRLPQLSGALKIYAGGAHSMALMPSGAVYGWGSNQQRQLGVSAGEYVSRPIVLGDRNVIATIASLLDVSSEKVPYYAAAPSRKDVGNVLRPIGAADSVGGYDFYQKIDLLGWIGVRADGLINYKGQPCGLPLR